MSFLINSSRIALLNCFHFQINQRKTLTQIILKGSPMKGNYYLSSLHDVFQITHKKRTHKNKVALINIFISLFSFQNMYKVI